MKVLDNLVWVFQNEPAVVTGAVDAALTAAVLFGLPVPADKKTAVDALVIALMLLVSAVVLRGKVSPVTPSV